MIREEDIVNVMKQFMTDAGIPTTEFSPEFAVKMMLAMMISFHKYGRVSKAYPVKFSATNDVRTRMTKYRETGNFWFLVDAANFAMIESMHPSHAKAHWGRNDADNSPGRYKSSGNLSKEDNEGNRSFETELHIPQNYS